MKGTYHTRIFIFVFLAWMAGSCCRVQRFEPREFVISNDTLCLDSFAYPLSRISLEHAVKYNDSYYCLFDKIGIYRGMYEWGRDPFMLEISDNATVIRQLTSPGRFLLWSDLYVRSDTLFWKNQWGEACYWEANSAEWIQFKQMPDIVYEDLDWQVAVRNGGEFGVFTWFIDRHSNNQYIYPILPERINRIDSIFYLTNKNSITILQDPRKGLLCDSDLRYENTLSAKYRNSTSVRLNANIWSDGFLPSMLPDTLLRADSVELITSFSIDTVLFSVVNSKDRTFIASLTEGQLNEEYNFNEKFEFVDISKNMDSRNLPESGALLKYSKGSYEMGLIGIEGYSIRQQHMFCNPDTLSFNGNDKFLMVMEQIRDGWDTLSFHMISDIESKTGSREVSSLIGNGYIPDSIKDRSIHRRFIQQIDSSLVFERSYWISEGNEMVMACFMDLYLNDVYKEMPSDMFESVPNVIKEIMGCEAQQIEPCPRNCMMRAWETPAMILQFYPYPLEDNIRIAVWRKE